MQNEEVRISTRLVTYASVAAIVYFEEGLFDVVDTLDIPDADDLKWRLGSLSNLATVILDCLGEEYGNKRVRTAERILSLVASIADVSVLDEDNPAPSQSDLAELFSQSVDLGYQLLTLSNLKPSCKTLSEAQRDRALKRGAVRSEVADREWRAEALLLAKEERRKNPKLGQKALARKIVGIEGPNWPELDTVIAQISKWVKADVLPPSSHKGGNKPA